MTEPTPVTYTALCVRCKAKRTFEGTESITATGRIVSTGPCPVCGTTLTKVIG